MRLILIFFLTALSCQVLQSQSLKGAIKDSDGAPIPYATVYIRELRQGTTANTKGDYEIRLPEGKYTVIYQSLGFEPEIKNIIIDRNILTRNVTLQVQTYEIPEVRITASGEDPAYGIMRKVIGMAPYYLNYIDSYKADIYLKGNLMLTRIPKIIKRQMKVEARKESGTGVSSTILKEGDTYMMESFNEIEFNAPDRYKQHVISSQSTFPEQENEISPMDFIKASFYEPVINKMFISPLSPEAFFHYRFRYLGVSTQGDNYIDKIEVTPKRKSQQLFQGTIYVIEDLWCLHSIDLVNENIAGKIRVSQLNIPVQENVWMPVSDKFEVNIAILGVRGEAGYGSSIKYKEVKLNTGLKKPAGLQEFKGRTTTETTPAGNGENKTSREIEKILSKNELSNHDMARLSSLMNRQTKESLPDSIKNNLEVKEKTTYVVEKDANKKDSAFWSGIRPIPLSENEMKSLRTSDSLKTKLAVTTGRNDTLKKTVKPKRSLLALTGEIAFGHTYSDTSGFSFSNGGLLNLKNLNFNTVDGFVYGIDFRVNKTWNKKQRLGIYPSFFYAFSRETFMWRLNGQFSFRNHSQSQIYFRSGSISKDLNGNSGISPLVNTVTSLFLVRNYLKLYSGQFLSAGYRTEITNGLQLDLMAGIEKRRILQNTTNFTLVESSRVYTDNTPGNEYLKNPADPYYGLNNHNHADLTVTVQYTPRQRYMLRGESKIPGGSDWPTFSLSWKHGLNDFEGMSPSLRQFDQLRFEVFQRKEIGAISEFRWRYRTGTFLKTTGFTFIDFNHFNSQYFPVLVRDYEDAFMLPRFYSQSTPEMFSELHMKYTTPYLLVKLIPGLSNTLMRENLSLSFLWTKYHRAYTELGYGISELFLVGELGIYAGFDNLSYSSVGLRLVFKID